jgi:hypothetical protein
MKAICFPVFAMVAVLTSSCSRNVTSEIHPESQEPANEDLIEAVRNSVAGKTYTTSAHVARSVAGTTRESRTCTQYDVDADPNAKNNPELARCPRVGATYWVVVPTTVAETTDVPETRNCESLPGPQYGWTVEPTGNDTWRVSYGGKSWNVEKKSFNAQSAPGMNSKRYEFAVTTDQPC